MTYDQAQSARLGQRIAPESTVVQMFDVDPATPTADLVEAAWHGMLVYRYDTSQLEVYDSNEGGWRAVAGGLAGQLTFVGPEPPTGGTYSVGDVWYDDDADYAQSVWDGSTWQLVSPSLVTGYLVEYAVNSSESTPPTTGWSTTTPTRTPGSYIWVRTTTYHQDGTTTVSAPALLTGNTGSTGPTGPTGPPGSTGPPGPTSDTLAPTATTTPVLTGGIGALFASWPAIVNNDPVTYQVHLSVTDGFTPGPTTLLARTPATSLSIRTLPDGTPLSYFASDGITNQLYYVRIVATDVDGTGPAGAQASGSIVQVTGPDVAANYVYAGTVVANQITGGTMTSDVLLSGSMRTAEAGQRVVINSTGVSLISSSEQVLASLPTDPTLPAFVKGVAELDRTTINGNLSMRGTTNEMSSSSVLSLAGKVNNPLQTVTPQISWDSTQTWITGENLCYGLTKLDSASPYAPGAWVTVSSLYGASLFIFGSNGSYGGNIPFPERPGTQFFNPVGGIATAPGAGDDLYILGHTQPVGGGALTWELRRYRITATPSLTLIRYHNYGSGADTRLGRALGQDLGTSPLMAWYNPSSQLVYSSMGIAELSGAYSQFDYLLSTAANPIGAAMTPLSGAARWTFDYGATRMLVVQGGSTTVSAFTAAQSTGNARSANDDFRSANGTTVKGLWGDASGNFFTLDSAGKLWSYTRINWTSESAQWWAGFSLADTKSAGTGTHESGLSLKSTFTMLKRAKLTLTAPAINNTGGNDDPDSVRLFVGRGATPPADSGMFLQAAPAVGVVTATLTTATFSGTIPVTNTFQAAPAAKIVDSTGNTLMDALGYSMFAPTGCIQMYAGSAAPPGWLLCDGTTKPQTSYPALFTVIGTSFNTGGEAGGDFRLPQLKDRFPVGAGATYALGTYGGVAARTLAEANLPTPLTVLGTGSAAGGTTDNAGQSVAQGATTGRFNHPIALPNASATPIPIIPPYVSVNYIIKT